MASAKALLCRSSFQPLSLTESCSSLSLEPKSIQCRLPLPVSKSFRHRSKDSFGSSSSLTFGRQARVICAVSTVPERTVPELNEGIAGFYDESSGVWEEIWGEHMHHGYYPKGEKKDHREAQIDMIEETLKWAGATGAGTPAPKTVVDVGCGIGGSSRYLSRKFGAKVTGITLSPVQAARAGALARQQGLADKVSFQVADALNQPFDDGQFDLVWSMESGEHMPDKTKFVNELIRVAAPGGRIIIVTWCHRDLAPGETGLQSDELDLLAKICDAYYLPAWCSAADYIRIAKAAGLQNVISDDWSERVTPFWPAVMASALSWRGLLGLAKSGWTTIKGAFAMALMIQGFSRGLIKFALISGTKASQ
ncbi:S-adenosyl-L-methionine dependent methyltransferases [Klebsormidium nitens]|uniref:S-adenosyl-L-methionine dependent methyltransferases n=1 Tax=Klebsormidium nitens TaxID=105231 RepID=A0A1Y1HH78_KLENI|nr:S-adenosyl-L-methionine dependent methyltransferases [Klebsormidium nitens]|eukprot:GAQ77795.1 S-adenosyl-L-methionine dependent methyltransferases [Klebsormidium nitens]